MSRPNDGSAGDADYALVGDIYRRYRQPDPRIAAFISKGLADARRVLNVGAGTGSYEPTDRSVTAVEPSASMRVQRPAHLPPAVNAVAEHLPFAADTFDAAMATFTIHQWRSLVAGLSEMRRVARDSVVILTCDPADVSRFWLNRYAPEALLVEARRYPPIALVREALGGCTDVYPVPIPLDCTDGFGEAYYGRPERLLDRQARLACSAWSFVDRSVVDRFEAQLDRDLKTGAWDAQFGHLRTQPQFEGSLRLVVSRR
jgi:SAM-dependent methyltransferase